MNLCHLKKTQKTFCAASDKSHVILNTVRLTVLASHWEHPKDHTRLLLLGGVEIRQDVMNQLVRFWQRKDHWTNYGHDNESWKNKTTSMIRSIKDLPRFLVLMKMTLFAPLSKAWKRLSCLAPDACSCATSFFSATSTSSSSAPSSSLLLPLSSCSCERESGTLLIPF